MEITTKVLKGPDGKVIGISLVAGPESYSEDFIERFPKALVEKEATISIDGQKLVFEGPTFSGNMRRFEFIPTPEELEGLEASIFAKDKKPTLEPEPFSLTPGFRLTVKN